MPGGGGVVGGGVVGGGVVGGGVVALPTGPRSWNSAGVFGGSQPTWEVCAC